MFRKNKKSPSPEHPATHAIEEKARIGHIETVKRTLDSLGIDEPVTIVGSTALYLHGLRSHRPIDTDVVVPARVLANIQREGMVTPSGLPARHETHYDNAGSALTFSVAVPRAGEAPQSVDLMSRFQISSDDLSREQLDSEMDVYDADFDTTVPYDDMDGLRVATVEYIYGELTRRKDSKAKMHRGALESALWGIGINPKTLRRK